MNFETLLRSKVMPGLRAKFGKDCVSGSSDARMVGFSLLIQREKTANCMFHIEETDLGFNLTSGTQNVNTQNEYVFTEDPENITPLIIDYVEKNKDVPLEGRTIMRFEELERQLGTLTGVDAEKLVNGEIADDLSDAVTTERDI